MPAPAVGAIAAIARLGAAIARAGGAAVARGGTTAQRLGKRAALKQAREKLRDEATDQSLGVTFDLLKGDQFSKLERQLGNPKEVLAILGPMMVDAIRRRFKEQHGVAKWKARKVPNVAGVIEDLKRGTAINAKRFVGKPALVDTGVLMNSFDYNIKGKFKVEVFTKVPYAAIHQTGGTAVIPIPPIVKAYLIKKRDPKFFKRFRWLLGAKQATIRIPPRPFMVIKKKDVKEFNKVLRKFFGDRENKKLQKMKRR